MTPEITVEAPEGETARAERLDKIDAHLAKARPHIRPSDGHDYKPRRYPHSQMRRAGTYIPIELGVGIGELIHESGGMYKSEAEFLRDAAFEHAARMTADLRAYNPMLTDYVQIERARRHAAWAAGQRFRLEEYLHHTSVELWGMLLQEDLDAARLCIERAWGGWGTFHVDYWRRWRVRQLLGNALIGATLRILTEVAGYTLPSDLMDAIKAEGKAAC